MRETDIKKAFGELNPTEEQKQRIKKQLQEKSVSFSNKSRTLRRAVATAASIVLIVFLAGVGVNAASGGKVIEYIGGLFTPREVSEDIINHVAITGLKGFEVWAPDLIEVSEERLIFGDRRGLIVYDRTKNEVASTLDLQAIDCAYFGGDTKDTKILVNDGKIVIYNTENEVPFGNYYIFDLENINDGLLEEYEAGENNTLLKEYNKEWKAYREKHFKDAFSEFNGSEPIENSDSGLGMYSKNLFSWEGGDSILYVDKNNAFYLYTRPVGKKMDIKEEIALGDLVKNSPVTSVLPEALYLGNDPIEKAVYEELTKEGKAYYLPDSVDSILIPILNPVGTVESEGEILYYGNFFIESFIRNGNTLESVSGGSNPGVMHLKKAGTDYVVTEFERAMDGSDFESSLKELTRGNEEIFENFFKGTGEENSREEAIISALREYLNHNGLQDEIKYYKEYGWDPVEIFN